jgi:hypothetical protein
VQADALACWRIHDDGDPLLGAPLCSACHDTQAAVLWNALANLAMEHRSPPLPGHETAL